MPAFSGHYVRAKAKMRIFAQRTHIFLMLGSKPALRLRHIVEEFVAQVFDRAFGSRNLEPLLAARVNMDCRSMRICTTGRCDEGRGSLRHSAHSLRVSPLHVVVRHL